MRILIAAALAGGLLAAPSLAMAQGGHGHKHDHAHDNGYDHDDGHDHGAGDGHSHKRALYKAEPRVVSKAHDHAHDRPHGHAHGVETESLFGFVSGSDIGAKGERHLTFFYDVNFGKRDGTFRHQQPKVELGYNPTDWLHVALELWGDHFKVRNVTDFDDQSRWGGGVAVEFKVQLAKRGHSSPVGLAFIVAPHYSNSEHHNGEAARHYALEFKLAADAELVKDTLFAAVNLLYEPERVRAKGEDEWEKESLFGISGALMARVAPAVFLGAEVQYFRKYEGFFFNEFHGHALYVGPALTVQTGDHSSFMLAWAAQVAGKAHGEEGRLDLEHFDRHRVRARWSTHF
jgi:hypothetical protein